MNIRLFLSLLCAFVLSRHAEAAADLDRIYAMRSMIPAVINADQDPVYAEHVENQIAKFLRQTPRFALNQAGYISFKEAIKDVYLFDPNTETKDKLEWIRPQIVAQREKEVDAVLVAEVFRAGEYYKLVIVMASTNALEKVEVEETTVEDRYSLDSFTQAVQEVMGRLEKKIPFDGTVIRRDGYRVVIDRAEPDVRYGQNISAYTLEPQKNGPPILVETGLITITDVGTEVSFGTILVEKKPLEVNPNNKVLLTGDPNRDPASLMATNVVKRNLGSVDLTLGANLITLNNLTASGSGASAANQIFPSARLKGHVWVTSRTFLELGIDFAFSSVGDDAVTQNSSVSDLRGVFGYKFGLKQNLSGPTFFLKGGYARHAVSVDASASPNAFNSMTFSGFSVGGGVTFPLQSRITVGFDVNALLLPGVSESPYTSGTSKNVYGWELAVHGHYNLNESMDILAQLRFSSYGSDFEGGGDRPIPVVSASQSARAFLVGVGYHF